MKRDITDRMDKIQAETEDRFTNLYCKKDFEYILKAAKEAVYDKSLRVQYLKKLADMFHDVGTPCQYGQSIAYYEDLLPLLEVAENTNDVNRELIKRITSLHSQFPTPSEFIERIVNSLEPETVLHGSLELRILRRFLRTVNVKENKKYFSKSLLETVDSQGIEAVNEDVFKAVKASKKSNCAPIVQGCYNLAKGRFISSVAIKELLVLFAFAFDMRYYFSNREAGYDVNRDVEKNLFIDYYCDNLTRYISLDDGGDDGISDREPSGTVINPKNFVDVLFVYYLNRQGLAAQEKVVRFYSVLEKIKKKWTTQPNYRFENEGLKRFNDFAVTGKYGDMLRGIQDLDENALIDYIISHYYCDFGYLYPVKEDEYYELVPGKGTYVRVDTDVKNGLLIEDHICIRSIEKKDTIVAIETADGSESGEYERVAENKLKGKPIGAGYFVYDEQRGAYLTKIDSEFPYVLKDGIEGHYVLKDFADQVDIKDHICIGQIDQKDTVLAIETQVDGIPYLPVSEDRLSKKKIAGGKFFVYDEDSRSYKRKRYSFKKVPGQKLEKQYLGTFALGFYKTTAFEQYLMILDLLRDEMQLPSQFHFPESFDMLDGRSLLNEKLSPNDKEYHDKLFKIEIRQWQENSDLMSLLSLYENIPELGENISADFANVFEKFVDRLDPEKVLCVTDPTELTRTKMIAAYYHFYVWLNTQERHSDTWRSFKDVYEDFSACTDQYLTDAGYQLISTKNLFDILIVFSAYCKINDFLNGGTPPQLS